MRRVPLARRNLLAEPRHLLASVAGIGLALMLILLLDSLWAGVRSQVTLFEDRLGGQLYVAAPGIQTLFAESSVIPIADVDVVRATPGVQWAAPVRALYAIPELHGSKIPVALVGFVPGQRGRPWALARGRTPVASDELVVDETLARRHDLRLGATVDLMGSAFRIVGLSKRSAGFMTSFMFVTHQATDRLLRAPGTTSFVLVGTNQPQAVRARLAARGLTVRDQAELRAADLKLATRIYGKPLQLMVAVAFAVGTLVIALTAYADVAERRREYGIVKAVGADRRRLTAIALGQTLGLAVLGLAASGLLVVAGRALIIWWRPQFAVVLTAGGLARAAVAALAMALVAGLVPARRLARLDPATAYRGA